MQYNIIGGTFPVVTCTLADGESMITEGGSMVWMTPNMEMSTTGGGIGKMFSKAVSGESLFQNIWTARGNAMIAFGSSFPGRIMPIKIAPGQSWILQKRAFLAAQRGVELSTHFNKSAKTGIFGGEGFIMQKLTGNGIAFAEIDGDLVEYQLAAGQQMVVDTGNVAGFEESVSIEAQMVKGGQEHLPRRRRNVQHRAHRSRPHLAPDDAHLKPRRGNRSDGLKRKLADGTAADAR